MKGGINRHSQRRNYLKKAEKGGPPLGLREKSKALNKALPVRTNVSYCTMVETGQRVGQGIFL